MSPEILAEMRAAAEAGLDATPFRPFHDDGERWGATRCGVHTNRLCNRPSTQVSYLIGFPGRAARCDEHVADPLAKVKRARGAR